MMGPKMRKPGPKRKTVWLPKAARKVVSFINIADIKKLQNSLETNNVNLIYREKVLPAEMDSHSIQVHWDHQVV